MKRIPIPVCLKVLLAGVAWLAAGPVVLGGETKDFEVESPLGRKVFRLSEARGKWVLVHFLLKTECPVCLRHTQEYVTGLAGDKLVEQVFLKPDSVEDVRAWSAKLTEPTLRQVPLYRDPDARWARAFGIPDGYAFHGQTVHFPALVVLDPDGKEVFRHVGKNNSDRYRFLDLAARLAEWKKSRAPGEAKPSSAGP